MSLENHKITTYQDNVKDLPDYPSDAGITAIQLKNIFDGRSDKEIKEKFNGLIDELKELFEEVKKGIETNGIATETVGRALTEHKGDLAAHEEVFARMQDEFTELINSRTGSNIRNGEGSVSLKQETWSEGSKNSAAGTGAVALGGYNKANAKCAAAVNYNNEVNALNAFAANQSNKIPAEAEGAFVAGLENEAKGVYQAIFGTYAEVEQTDAFVIGNGTKDAKSNAFSVDKSGNAKISGNAEIRGSLKSATVESKTLNAEERVATKKVVAEEIVSTKSVVAEKKSYVGCGVVNEKDLEFAQNVVEGAGAVAFGGSNEVYGRNGFALMTSNTIPADCESVFIAGHANIAAASHQAIFGTYAAPAASDIFVVGIGTSEARRNAFKIDRSGNIRIAGDLEVFGAAEANTMLVYNSMFASDITTNNVKANGGLTIGNTGLNEEQLKKLLALIE